MEENNFVESQSRRECCSRKKKEIETLLANHREEIETGQLRVFLIDECHLMWGDLSGYVWGKTDQEITVPVVNQRNKQTYYGAIDYIEKELHTHCLRCR